MLTDKIASVFATKEELDQVIQDFLEATIEEIEAAKGDPAKLKVFTENLVKAIEANLPEKPELPEGVILSGPAGPRI